MKPVKYWTYKTFNNHYKFTKRYVVYLFTWWWDGAVGNSAVLDNASFKTNDYAEFDDLTKVSEHIELIKNVYANVEKPEHIKEHMFNKQTGKIVYKGKYGFPYVDDSYEHIYEHYECDNGKKHFWGYVVLDYQKEDIISMGGDVHPEFKNYKKNLALYDDLFRKPGEVPADYKWDDGEYEGWLQFRWGNGLNAIDVEDEINRKKKEAAQKARLEKENNTHSLSEELLDDYRDDNDYLTNKFY